MSVRDVIPGQIKEPYRPYNPAKGAARRSGWEQALWERTLNPVEERSRWDGVTK